jgi:hypothetical protein
MGPSVVMFPNAGARHFKSRLLYRRALLNIPRGGEREGRTNLRGEILFDDRDLGEPCLAECLEDIGARQPDGNRAGAAEEAAVVHLRVGELLLE